MYTLFLAILLVASSTASEKIGLSKLKLDLLDETSDSQTGTLDQLEHGRVTRQVHGSTYLNSDKTSGVNVKMPFASNDKNVLSVVGGLHLDEKRKLQSATAGVALDNVKGHGLSLTNSHIPDFGDRVTLAGHANVFHNTNHDVTANAFLTRSMPATPNVPNFNTVGGSMDYMYKNRVGGSLGAAHTPFLDRTDYSAMGNLNIIKDRSSSLDFNAGFRKSVSPFTKSSWEPSVGLTFRKFF